MATTKKASLKKAPLKKTTAARQAEAVSAPVSKMTKAQLIRFMAEKLQTSPRHIDAFLDLLVETAAAQTQGAGEFTLPGLGKLVKAERKARTGRNPATGESIQIAAKTTVKFRLAKSLQDSIMPPKK